MFRPLRIEFPGRGGFSYIGRTLREIADFYGRIKYPGVSQAWRRMETRKETDKEIARIIIETEEELDKVSNVKT